MNVTCISDDCFAEEERDLEASLSCNVQILHCVANNIPAVVKLAGARFVDMRAAVMEVLTSESTLSKIVNVVDCNEAADSKGAQGYDTSEILEMKYADFLEARKANPDYLYLKDFHAERDASLVAFDSVPLALRDDWLHYYYKFYKHHRDDYSFLYFGGEKTKTLVHHDVIRSFSWSLNITGKKKWTFWHPKEAFKLCRSDYRSQDGKGEGGDSDGRYCNNDELVANPHNYDKSLFPLVASAESFSFLQSEGEVVYVPSGWHHMVENFLSPGEQPYSSAALSPTHISSPTPPTPPTTYNSASASSREFDGSIISINRNWFNGSCLAEIWDFLLDDLNNVRNSLQCFLDDKANTSCMHSKEELMSKSEWNLKCEEVLRQNSSINITDFVDIILCRLSLLCYCCQHSFIDDVDVINATLSAESFVFSSLVEPFPINPTEDEFKLLELMKRTVIDKPLSRSNLLSHYSISNVYSKDIRGRPVRGSQFFRINRDVPSVNLQLYGDDSPSPDSSASSGYFGDAIQMKVVFPMTYFQLTCWQMIAVLEELANSPKLLDIVSSTKQLPSDKIRMMLKDTINYILVNFLSG